MLTESWVEERDAQPTERTAALWGLSSKIDSRIWVNFTRNGLRLGSRHQESPHTDVSRNLATVVVRGVLSGLRRRRTGLLPSGPKSSFQMRASFVFYLETKVLESGGRVEKPIAQVAWCPVLSFHSLWFGVPKAPKVAWLASKLTRPEPHREYMGYCQEENEKQETKKCRWAEGHLQRNLGFHTTSALSQIDHLHATPNWGSD